MASYIESSLSRDESVQEIFTLHWFAWMPVIIWVVLGLLTFGLTWLIAIYQGLSLKYLEQGLTNKRVILKRGIVSRRTDEIKLRSIETVEIDQGVLGRIFGFGTVKVTGRGISRLDFKNIDDPMRVKREIESVSSPIE
ncbi:PH domain-containing protein [Marinobacter psychrophilus]|jgi:uncharacterized membrane protein YdbT with pleckstrin-like domain|uniref:PH domain-containing protein n=1 Tax=Marinobacter psychrophilus TaxID=330734 RepID=UPI00069DD122|nr:PH domain-containing protein [Marinobacter psychrophilus]